MTRIRAYLKTAYAAIMFSVSCFFIISCDSLEGDSSSVTPAVHISNNEIHILADGAGYIDLRTMLKVSGQVRLELKSLPSKGTLQELRKGFMKYSPYQSFRSGHDLFTFSVFSNQNTLLVEDTVTIIVQSDTTNLPCGVYAVDDFVYGIQGPVTVDVKINDMFCGEDTAKVVVQIYRPDNSFPPHYGTATMVDNKIQYIPGSNFSGIDTVVYKLSHTEDPTRFSFATLNIQEVPACEFSLADDNYVFHADTIDNPVQLPVFNNDLLCNVPLTNYSFQLLRDGDVGQAAIVDPIRYQWPAEFTQTFTDTLEYRVCFDGNQMCKQAKVAVTIVK